MFDKPRVAVIGLGRYFGKLRFGMLKWFRPEILIDLGDKGSEPGHLYEKLASDRPDAIMILTPNQTGRTPICALLMESEFLFG